MKYLRNHFPIRSLFLAATFSLLGFMSVAQETTLGDTELVVRFCHLGDDPVTYAYRVRESGQIETLDGAPGTGLRSEREDVLLLPGSVLRFRDQEISIDANGEIDTGHCSNISDVIAALVADFVEPMAEQLEDAVQVRENFAARLAEALARVTELEEGLSSSAALSELERQLADALTAQMLAESTAEDLAGELSLMEEELARALARLTTEATESHSRIAALNDQVYELERLFDISQANDIVTLNEELETAEAASAESQRQIAALNEQVAALRTQLSELQGLLDASRASDAAAQVQVETLGADLNAALARLASEQEARAEAEAVARRLAEAEARRLAEAAQLMAD